MGVFESSQTNTGDASNIAGNNAGKVGRVARAGTTMWLARYARIFRVVRLVRVTRLFRVCMADGVHQVEIQNSRPSNVGRLLAQKATQRIVALIIAMIFVLPYLEVAPVSGELSMLTSLESISHINPSASESINISVSKLLSSMVILGSHSFTFALQGMPLWNLT